MGWRIRVAGWALAAAICVAAGGSVRADQNQKFGEVTDVEWQLQPPVDFPDANAAVLFDRIRVEGGSGDIWRHVRMKAFNRAGVSDISEVSIDYSKKDRIRDLKAQTLAPGGEVYRVAGGAIYEKSIGDERQKTFAFPQADSGCIVEYTYKIIGKKPVYWDYQPFSHPIYTYEMEYTFRTSKAIAGPYWSYDYYTHNVVVGKVPSRTELPNFIWKVEEIPAMTDEPYMGFKRSYQPAASVFLKPLAGIEMLQRKQWPIMGEMLHGVYREYMTQTPIVDSTVGSIVTELNSSYEKAKAIYNFVTSSVETRQNRYGQEFHHDNIEGILTQGYGTSTEKNLLLVEMLVKAEIKAWPVMICTRDVAKFTSELISPYQFNHLIVFAEVEQGGIYLDATTKYNAFGTLPPLCRTDVGLLLDDSESELVDIITNDPASTRTDMCTYRLDTFGRATCTTAAMCTGYLTAAYGRAYETSEPDEFLDDDILHITRDGYHRGTFETSLDSLHRFRVVTGYTVEGAARQLEDNLVADLPENVFSRNPFQSKRRTFPIDFRYPFTYQAIVTIIGPNGAAVSAAPPDTAFMVDGLIFERRCSGDGQTVQIKSTVKVGRPLFEVAEYTDVREFFIEVEKAAAEKVVFSMMGGQ